MEEWEFFNNKIEIIKECLFNIFSDIVVQCWLNMEGFVRFFYFFDPHIKRIQFLFDQIIKVIFGVEDSVDGSHQEREEGSEEEEKKKRRGTEKETKKLH